MKKLLILFPLLAIAILPAAAQDWKTIKLDSAVSLKLPFAYKITDTLSQRMLISKLSYGDVQVLVTPDNPQKMPDIEKKKHLLKYYDSYLKKVKAASAKGIVAHETDTMLGNLHVKDFTLEVDSGHGKQLRDFRILHENGATYTFQLLYEGIHQAYMAEERDQFFRSIQVANSPEIQSQFTEGAGNGTDYTIYYIIAAVVVLIIVLLIIMRSKRRPPAG